MKSLTGATETRPQRQVKRLTGATETSEESDWGYRDTARSSAKPSSKHATSTPYAPCVTSMQCITILYQQEHPLLSVVAGKVQAFSHRARMAAPS